ncbi:CLUMA_CG009095, isoform A [Clunio marinus]|uniref:CLUMA_CG009095, isoform A n=1 Tax=Clunio marinus TaxID=568069 RepID=A0A1J1I5R6_9DIPT|nr:CLUMA_CG009095, isoform A [Clunio marinus]
MKFITLNEKNLDNLLVIEEKIEKILRNLVSYQLVVNAIRKHVKLEYFFLINYCNYADAYLLENVRLSVESSWLYA